MEDNYNDYNNQNYANYTNGGGYGNQSNNGGYYENYNNGGYYQNNWNGFKPALTPGQWILTILISSIPCVGAIMLFVWAFSNDGQEDRKNWARANLIIALIAFVFIILLQLLGFTFAFGPALQSSNLL